jgi:hypothetical protein
MLSTPLAEMTEQRRKESAELRLQHGIRMIVDAAEDLDYSAVIMIGAGLILSANELADIKAGESS